MVYAWKPGSRIKTPASVAGAVCERLEADGGLTPSRLVEESRPADAPLHNEFEWDDTAAAEKYREAQAGHIIRCIVAVKDDNEPEPTQVRAFFPVTKEAPNNYVHITKILSDEDRMNNLLEQAKSEMRAFMRKYAALEKLRPVIEEMEKVAERRNVNVWNEPGTAGRVSERGPLELH